MSELKLDKLIIELTNIRSAMDKEPTKAKQQLTNLTKNLINKIGVCFK